MCDDNSSGTTPASNGRDYESRQDEASLDEIYGVLERGRRREVLSYLMDCPSDIVPVEEVVDVVAERERPEPGPGTHRKRVETELHHVHLPKLADVDAIAYDPADRTVRYTASERLETVLEANIAFDEEENNRGR